MSFINGIMDARFSGVFIDTKGFADGGAAINDYYMNTLGLAPIITDDNWLYYYALDEQVLRP